MQWTEIGGLADALELGRHEHVALVGGGGKTTALFALGRQLAGRVVLTTTTKMGCDRTGGYEALIGRSESDVLVHLNAEGAVLVWASADDRRAHGIAPEDCDRLFSEVDHVVVEADGSRRRPFKAPAAHEPVVPATTTVLIACVGAGAFGQPIEEVCHRPGLVAELAEVAPAHALTPAVLAAVLAHPDGSMKGRPPDARMAILVNQAHPERDATFFGELAEWLPDGGQIVAVPSFSPEDSPES